MKQETSTFKLVAVDGTEYDSVEPGTLGGHRKQRIYGRLDCWLALKAIARGGYMNDRVFFADESTAISAGYRPCAKCMKSEYDAWKKTKHGQVRIH